MDDDFRSLFNNDGMSDDEFRKNFMKLIAKRRIEMDNFMRNFYGSGGTSNPFDMGGFFGSGNMYNNKNTDNLGPTSTNDIFNMLKKMYEDLENSDDNGKTNFWSSPDGSIRFYSSSTNINPEDIGDIEDLSKYFGGEKKTEEPLGLLKRKLQKAIEEERFEEAAKYRDSIKALEGGETPKNDGE